MCKRSSPVFLSSQRNICFTFHFYTDIFFVFLNAFLLMYDKYISFHKLVNIVRGSTQTCNIVFDKSGGIYSKYLSKISFTKDVHIVTYHHVYLCFCRSGLFAQLLICGSVPATRFFTLTFGIVGEGNNSS